MIPSIFRYFSRGIGRSIERLRGVLLSVGVCCIKIRGLLWRKKNRISAEWGQREQGERWGQREKDDTGGEGGPAGLVWGNSGKRKYHEGEREKFELHILLLVRIGSDISDKQRRAEYFWFHCEEAGDGRGIMS